MATKARVIAFYLPQFHPIPLNDEWWGKGFTEWVNVKRAKPLYRGHNQPRVPLYNNYYNLLDRSTVKWQENLLHQYKIDGLIYYHCWYDTIYGAIKLEKDFGIGNLHDKPMARLATEEEKQQLFDAIKANGCKWKDETKTFEKLIIPKFKVGDIIQDEDGQKVKITEVNIDGEFYSYESDMVKRLCILFSEQDEWKLVPNKFDINTIKPFDKVLGRTNDSGIWKCDLFSHYNDDELFIKFRCIGLNYRYCIPYKGNEHLLGTRNECDEYFKTWEE